MIENKLKELRKKNKITQTLLADEVLSTRQTIYLIEHHKSVPSLELALKISQFFGLHIEEIFSLKEKDQVHKKKKIEYFKIGL
jgi:putative transcriptional regulator